jgi:hypothetical protein
MLVMVHILLGFSAVVALWAAVTLFYEFVLDAWDWVERGTGIFLVVFALFVAAFVTWGNIVI